MAKKIEDVTLPDMPDTETAKKPKTDKSTTKMANLLRDLSGAYREASIALRSGDDAGYAFAQRLIVSYQGLFNTIAEEQGANLTAEGLAAISEM